MKLPLFENVMIVILTTATAARTTTLPSCGSYGWGTSEHYHSHRRTPTNKKSTARRVDKSEHHISSHLFNRVPAFLGAGGESGVLPRSLLLLAGDIEIIAGPGKEKIDVLAYGNDLSVEYERLGSSSNSIIDIVRGNEDMDT